MHDKEFSWPTLFLVTGCSAFLFNFALKLMDDFSELLFIIGSFSLFLGTVNWAGKMLARHGRKRNGAV